MLQTELVGKILDCILDAIKESSTEIYPTYNVTYAESQFPKSIQGVDVKALYNKTDIKELSIELPLPTSPDFQTRIFCEETISNYQALPLTWDFHSLTVEIESDTIIDLEDFESFIVYEFVYYCEYPDLGSKEYYEAKEELHQECLGDYGLFDFRGKLQEFLSGLYITLDTSNLSDHEDLEWLKTLFHETLMEDYIEENGFVYTHDLAANEDKIIKEVESNLDVCVVGTGDVLRTVSLSQFDDIELYQVMGLKDFTLIQLANLVWLQENKTWSDKNLVFVSGCGFYAKLNKYTYALIEQLQLNKPLNHDSFKALVNQLAKSDASWHANWQGAVKYLSAIPGCDILSNLYGHGDKYDIVCRELFMKVVREYPNLCSLSHNWFSLKVDTKIIPETGYNFERLERSLSHFTVKFDIEKAISNQIKDFPGFTKNVAYYMTRRLEQLEEAK